MKSGDYSSGVHLVFHELGNQSNAKRELNDRLSERGENELRRPTLDWTGLAWT